MILTKEHLQALEWCRTAWGRRWKAQLLTAWAAGLMPRDVDTAAALQQLRNRLGPAWLAKYRPGDKQVGWLMRGGAVAGGATSFRAGYCITQVDGKSITHACTSKAEARQLARDLAITLIEDTI